MYAASTLGDNSNNSYSIFTAIMSTYNQHAGRLLGLLPSQKVAARSLPDDNAYDGSTVSLVGL